jgi:uncharacterized protein (TIGR00369 family)
MRIDRADALGPAATSLRIEGRVGHRNRSGGLGRAVFVDDTGVTVAHGMATMAVVGRPPGPGGWSLTNETGPGPDVPLFDARRLELAPIWDGPDVTSATVPIDPSMANPHEQVHGGVLLTIAERAQRRMHPAGSAVLTMTIEYLRPAGIDADHITCRSTSVRRGRRYSTVRTELVRPDGKVAAEATGIASVEG